MQLQRNVEHLHNFQGGNVNKFPGNSPNQTIIAQTPGKENVKF